MQTSPPSIWRRGRSAGFTLVELVITIAIVAILSAIAAPAMTNFLADQAAAANADEFAAAVRFSRTEAIKRGRVVTMCASTTPSVDAPPCDGADWKTGWAITEPSGAVLRVQEGLRAVESADGSATTLTFAPNGIVTAGGGDYVFLPLGGDEEKQRAVNVSATGRVRICAKGEDSC